MAQAPAAHNDLRTWMTRGARVFTWDGADAGTVAEVRDDGLVVAPREGAPFHVPSASVRSGDPDGIWLEYSAAELSAVVEGQRPAAHGGMGRLSLHDSSSIGSVHAQELARAKQREEHGVFRDADTGYLSDAARRAFDGDGGNA